MGNLSLGDMIRDIETNQAACFSLGFGGQMVGSRQEKPNFQDENWRMTWMMQRGTPRFRTSEDRDESSPIICQFSMCSMCSIYDWGFELPEDLLFENWTAPGAPGAPDPMVLHERMTITRSPKGFLDRKVKNTWKLSKHHRTTLWLSPGIVNGWVHPVITVLSLLTLLIAMVPKQKRDRGMIRQVIIYQLFMYNPCITLQIPIKKNHHFPSGDSNRRLSVVFCHVLTVLTVLTSEFTVPKVPKTLRSLVAWDSELDGLMDVYYTVYIYT